MRKLRETEYRRKVLKHKRRKDRKTAIVALYSFDIDKLVNGVKEIFANTAKTMRGN